MVTIRLMGGMCNQLFQYAFGRALEKRGATVSFSSARCSDFRPYALDKFQTRVRAASGEPSPVLFEPSLRYQESLLEVRDGTVVGYFQTEKYFKEIAQEIKSELRPLKPLSDDSADWLEAILKQGESSCFVHVRRGDYVNLQEYHGLMTVGYYAAAIEFVRRSVKLPRFFVFSDDEAWCKDNLRAADVYVVPTHSPCEDLTLMKYCRHAVLANSSFSWWGNWLGTNGKPRVVVAPKRWFAAENVDATDIYSDSWQRL